MAEVSYRQASSPLADAARGAIAGGVATWVMDLVTTGLLESQSEEATERERAAQPNGKTAIGNLVDRIERATGSTLDDRTRNALIQAIHFGVGIGPGAAYAVLRRRLPGFRAARGLAFGALLWALNDEYLNTKLGLAAPFGAYPLETHWRGLVGHVVLGGATDSIVDVLGG